MQRVRGLRLHCIVKKTFLKILKFCDLLIFFVFPRPFTVSCSEKNKGLGGST